MHRLGPPADHIRILTGQSGKACTALPEAQRRFLEACAVGELEPLNCGFPWGERIPSPRGREPFLLTASWRNAKQFAYAQLHTAFRLRCAAVLEPLLSAEGARSVIIAGSCGYQLAAAGLNQLRGIEGLLLLVSVGAVGFDRTSDPNVRQYHIRGRKDLISAVFSGVRVDRIVESGHMGYWTNGEVLRLCKERIHDFYFGAP